MIIAAALTLVVDSVRIESRWSGLGTPSDRVYKIVRRGGHNERGLRAVIPTEAVERLVSAMEAAPVEREAALRAIATPEWLASVAHQPPRNASVPSCSADAKRLFEQRVIDPAFALQVLDAYFSSPYTDDDPFVAVDVTLHGGRKLHAESSGQQALMLPWTVGSTKSWNPELPRAIAALIPAGAEPRVSGQSLEEDLAEDVGMELRYELDPLEERCVHHDMAEAVERKFEIVHIYHGSGGWFTAYVRRSDFPPNLVLTLVIRDSEKPDALGKLDRTAQRVGMYVDVVRPYLAAHPQTSFALWCADGLSVDAREVFVSDENMARLKANADRAVRLLEYEPATGYVHHERFILSDGDVIEENPSR
jgi:hypothetical protein